MPWLHLWPGLVLTQITGIIANLIEPNFSLAWPLVFWFVHFGIDSCQKNEAHYSYYNFFYPLVRQKRVIKIGYPAKPPIEFIIGSHLWMVVAIILFALLIAKP